MQLYKTSFICIFIQLSIELIEQCNSVSIPVFLSLTDTGVQWTKEVKNRHSFGNDRLWKIV